MLVIDDEKKFGIMWEVLCKGDSDSYQFYYGTMMFIIGDEVLPKKLTYNYTLDVIFSHLKKSFLKPYYPAGKTSDELGSIPVDIKKLSYGEIPNVCDIETAEIGMAYTGFDGYGGVQLSLAYSGESERLFYSEDNGNTFRELVLQKGTVESVINQLPNRTQLEAQLQHQSSFNK
ncbi:hypothetical protein [Psychrobacter sp. FDAARGOS_221]|uniref:hypothetical protein n=1 Tax=Psychrobacter sp. FDAARGOS_221 TaxID=1975705 RepID=UPI000BB560E4|nr:hypothetical protein [Psychrobacter sp. FDAARGOS_221]PNK59600.1 hypothetical protein A6J60_001010 [Psychrobacter sp. FDAARGOS_221]